MAHVARFKSVNQFNHLHLKLDSTIAPSELAEIGRLSESPDLPRQTRDWLAPKRRRSPDLFINPQPFVRREVTERLLVFEGAGRTRDRRLLIAFTGRKRQMMIPTAEFLQAIDASVWDVVCLKWTNMYLDGVEGVANTLDGVLARVLAEVGGRGYASVSTIGVSAGGAAAAIAALRLRARRGLSVSGVIDKAFLAAQPRRSTLGALLGRPRLAFAYGGGFEPDRVGAFAMANAWSGAPVCLPKVASHNVMIHLLKHGRLAAFLERLL